MDLSKLVWLAPPVIGLAAYFHASSLPAVVLPSPEFHEGDSPRKVRVESRRIRSIPDFDAALASADQAVRGDLEKFKKEFISLPSEEIRRQLLLLNEEMTAGKSRNLSTIDGLMKDAATTLAAREGATQIDWMVENLPEYAAVFFQGWAKVDPSGALDYLSRTDQPGLCDEESVMVLLRKNVAGNPEALRKAVERMPWELYPSVTWRLSVSDEFPGPGVVSSPEVRLEEAMLWVKSGAAHFLADQGIELDSNLLPEVSSADFPAALAAWMDWPHRLESDRADALVKMVERNVETQQRAAALEQTIRDLDPAAGEKIRAVWSGFSRDGDLKGIHALVPSLRAMASDRVPEGGDK